MEESEPMIALVGDIFDLDSLEWWSAQSKSPLYSVMKKDNSYWLKSPRFGLLTDQFCMRIQAEELASIAQELIAIATEMTAKAKELIPIIKASAKVRRIDVQSIEVRGGAIIGGQRIHVAGDYRPVENGNKITIWKENGIFYEKFRDSTLELGREISPVLLSCYKDRTLELDARIREGLMLDSYLHPLEKICIDDPYIYETFCYFAEEPSWYNLYNIYEMIKYDADGHLGKFDKEVCNITKWAEQGELAKFKEAANNPRAEGRSRHSSAYYLAQKAESQWGKNPAWCKYNDDGRKKQKKPELMSPYDANELITRVFRRWCRWKVTGVI